jgi:hypothetical protein
VHQCRGLLVDRHLVVDRDPPLAWLVEAVASVVEGREAHADADARGERLEIR